MRLLATLALSFMPVFAGVPERIPNLGLHLDAATVTGFADGATLPAGTVWADQSGNGNHATSVGASGITFKATAQNGLPGVSIGTGGAYFTHGYSGEPGTVIAVVYSTGGLRSLLTAQRAATGSGCPAYNIQLAKTGGGTADLLRTVTGSETSCANLTVNQNPALASQWTLSEWTTDTSAGAAMTVYGNNLQIATGSTATAAVAIASGAATHYLGIGYFGGPSGALCNCVIGELLIYSRVLTVAERATLRGYLERKWFTPSGAYQYYGFYRSGSNDLWATAASADGITWTPPSSLTGTQGYWPQINAPKMTQYRGARYGMWADADDLTVQQSTGRVVKMDAGGIPYPLFTFDMATLTGTVLYTFAGDNIVTSDGVLHFITVCSAGNVTTGPWVIYEMHPTNNDPSTWTSAAILSTPVAITITGLTDVYDPAIFQYGSTFYFLGTRYNGGARKTILAASSTLMGPYAVQVDPFITGTGSGIEGPHFVNIPNGVRVNFEQTPGVMKYRDCLNNSDLVACSWTASASWTVTGSYPFANGQVLRNPGNPSGAALATAQ